MVVDFKNTLESIGYDPWIDEEAMPAGVSVERALLQGMKDSCAVVFFITPSFRDEGYLETEINYAIQEKREKGDQFAIITLLFDDAEHGTVHVPELLRPYVWKKPRTQLQALTEIIRALPITPVSVDWKEEATNIVKTREVSPAASGLSEEAMAILREAAKADGLIHIRRPIGNVRIHIGGKIMNQDQKPRTIARWEGGLEELQRYRYIKVVGHKGDVFKVTKEGYDAADALPGE